MRKLAVWGLSPKRARQRPANAVLREPWRDLQSAASVYSDNTATWIGEAKRVFRYLPSSGGANLPIHLNKAAPTPMRFLTSATDVTSLQDASA